MTIVSDIIAADLQSLRVPVKKQFPLAVVAFRNPNSRTGLTCEGSADARGIPVGHELKSILLKKRQTYIMAHVLGGCDVDLKAVTRLVGGKVELVTEIELQARGLEKCRVSPFTARHYLGEDVQHVFCPSTLRKPILFTNHDSLNEAIMFSPFVLLATFPEALHALISQEKGSLRPQRFVRQFNSSPSDSEEYRQAATGMSRWIEERLPKQPANYIKRHVGEFLANQTLHAPSDIRVVMELRPAISFRVIIHGRGTTMPPAKVDQLRTRFETPASQSKGKIELFVWSTPDENQIDLRFDLTGTLENGFNSFSGKLIPPQFDLKVMRSETMVALLLPPQCHIFHPEHAHNHKALQECSRDERNLILDATEVRQIISSATWPLQLLLRKRSEAGLQHITPCLCTAESERVLLDSSDFSLQVLPFIELVRKEDGK